MTHISSAKVSWPWAAPLSEDEPCHWYAIADAAQHKSLPGALVQTSQLQHRCLFDAAQDSPIAAYSPHLVALPAPSKNDETSHPAWRWIERYAPDVPCVTVLASSLPDGEDMYFAFWDPMILGTLMGQPDDRTLYVAGAVLDESQRAGLTTGIQSWWYWDRGGQIRAIKTDSKSEGPIAMPMQLNYQQMDMLVEASIPDHVLHHVEQNQPHLLSNMNTRQRYNIVREHLVGARSLGLNGMGDMVNYVCAALIYGPDLRQDPQITGLLEQVRAHRLTLDQALEAMP